MENIDQALETIKKLRLCSGVAPANYEHYQFVIIPELSKNKLHIENYRYSYEKFGLISPCFFDRESAQRAIDSIGKETIISMFATLSGQ